jgi:ATP synthase protein I
VVINQKKRGSPEEDQHETNIKAGIAYGAAVSLFAAVVGGLIVGWLLDRWLSTGPWLLVVGLILGAAAGFYEFIRATSRLN